MHFDLDSHDSYRAGADDPDRMVPNPAKKPAYQQVEKARRALHWPKPPATPRCWTRTRRNREPRCCSPTR